MKLSLRSFLLAVLAPCLLPSVVAAAQSSAPITLSSPDGRIQLQLSATNDDLTYTVTCAGTPVLLPSTLGLRVNDVDLGQAATLGTPQRRHLHQQYRFWGAHALATIDANEATIPARSHGESFLIDLHVSNDGVAVRLRLPARPNRHIQADLSSWHLPADPTLWADKLDPAYESPYHTTTLSQLGPDPLGLPLTAQLPGNLFVTLTEAAVTSFGDLAVQPGPDHVLHGTLYADPAGWSTSAPVVQPWRVTVIARNLTELVNTTLVQDSNPAPQPSLARAAWIHPGRSSWQWLSSGDPVESEQHQWVDNTARLGFEYYLIDEGWASWKSPWPSLAETVQYARSKHVKIWIWVHSKDVTDPAARQEYFRRAVQAGVVGVKIDFPPPSSHTVSQWYVSTAQDAAAAHLMVDFHGATKPTGIERTWPNVLTREGVRGHEWHITRYHRVLEPDHDVILPFTRYIAGPGDYTPTVFTPSELVGNTWAHELAQAVLFTSPFLCFGGSPASYLANPAHDVLTAIPATWDETRVLPGSQPGVLVAEARRSGTQWFIAVINGADPTDLPLDLSVLGPGAWKATLLRDAADPASFDREDTTLPSSTTQTLHLQPRGGFVAWLHH